MKKFITTICAALVFCFALSGVVTEAKTIDYQRTVSKDYRVSWSNGKQKIYMNKAGTKLYAKDLKSGKATLLQKMKADEIWDYQIANVYGNNIYLDRISEIGETQVYIYNMKNKTFKLFKKHFNIQSAAGKYMVTASYLPTDISPYPTYLYQDTGKGLKKIAKLGSYTSGAVIINGKVYYAAYPKSDNMSLQKMGVYTCDLDGQNKTRLFTRNVTGENAYIQPEEFTAEKITFAECDGENDPVEYVYDCATGTIAQVTK